MSDNAVQDTDGQDANFFEQTQHETQEPALRTDLFGDSESEADETDAPPSLGLEGEEELLQPAPDDKNAAVEEATPLEAEEPVLEQISQGLGSPSNEGQASPADLEGEQEEPEPGKHGDIFASDSEGEEEGQRQAGHISEAEEEDEEDEFEAMFKSGKKRKKKGQTQEIVLTVETLIANMEVAAEIDIAANEEGKPAVHKIKMLPSVEEKLSQTILHRELLDGGILGALKLWIELLPNGSLPNVKVRTAVLKMLHKLPIDLNLDGRKEQLKKSELGKYIMFYSKLPDETLANRQLARSLVEKWSRPIFEAYRERGHEEELKEREADLALLRKRRRQEAEQAAPKQQEPGKPLRPGDPGFRWHASIPAPARLDYMRQPESAATTEGEAVKGKAKPKDKMSKKLAAMSRKGGKRNTDAKVSLQGRGLYI